MLKQRRPLIQADLAQSKAAVAETAMLRASKAATALQVIPHNAPIARLEG